MLYNRNYQCYGLIILQKQTHWKRDQIYGYQRWEWRLGEAELDEGSQEVQTSSYKINNYQGYNMQHDNYNSHCCMVS